MPLIKVYSTGKKKVSEMELNEGIFNAEIKDYLLHDVIRMQLAKRRAGTASTMNRSAVRGGGRKPYRQKGTGRSRAGSIRSPLWKGGGVIFGPTPRDFGFDIPKKMRKQALRIALSMRVGEGKLLVLNQFQLKEIKTKSFLEVLSRFGMKKALIVIGQENFNLEQSARNVPGVKVLRVEGLNVYDILHHENLILVKEVVDKIQERLAS
ncbi:MAG: 50S ribosomal protein L4 [Syntrophobacterales bacterium]|nr:MAG: 50S ribosomal protein L4 [Syntrophobacterales bacterium]